MATRKPTAVLLIGAGRMGGALLKGWIAARSFSAIHVVDPLPSRAAKALARAKKIKLHKEFDASRLPPLAAAVLALKPQVIKNEGALLRALGQTGALTLSIAAGITTEFLGASLGSHERLVRAMPNTPGSIGKGITVLYSAPGLSRADRALAEKLTAPLGTTLWLGDESLMDAVTALSGSGPAYVFLMAEAFAAAGRAQGLDGVTAEKLARATVSGAGALLEADSRPAPELRQEVTSPGGTTEAALKVLMAADGLEELMRRAIEAATRRGKELGKT
jgi:pyrroline-5-carboxylate reductase